MLLASTDELGCESTGIFAEPLEGAAFMLFGICDTVAIEGWNFLSSSI